MGYCPLSPLLQKNLDTPSMIFQKSQPPVNKGVHTMNITYGSPEAVQMVRQMRGTFEFDQPYKQTKSKMQVTGKISSSK